MGFSPRIPPIQSLLPLETLRLPAFHDLARTAATLQATPPADSVAVRNQADLALILSFLQKWTEAPSAGAASYEAARRAAQAGDRDSAVRNLEQAVLAHPAHALAAEQEADFTPLRGDVAQLLAGLTQNAKMRAEVSLATAEAAWTQAPIPVPAAAACLDAAKANLAARTFAGYMAAAEAAELARGMLRSRNTALAARSGTEESRLGMAARFLWERLPLLYVLLVWFAVGVTFGGFTFLWRAIFPDSGIAAWQDAVFPVWGLGLVLLVLAGFLRSLLRMRER